MAKTVKTPTTDDLFDALAQGATPTDTKPKGQKKDKPQIELNDGESQAFESFCAADIIYKMAEGKQKAAKSLVIPFLRRKLLDKWLVAGHKTENPSVVTNKARANFVVRDILKVEIPEREDGKPGSVKDRLLDVGFDEDVAENIYKREFVEKTELNFRPLNDLRNGSPAEQEVVKKLLQLVLKNFDKQEQALLLRREVKVEVNDGFLDRAVSHVEGSAEKLDALLTVVSPQWVLSHMTYSGKDLGNAVAELTGGELPSSIIATVKTQEFYSPDREWKVVTKGNEASLYFIEGGQEKLLGTKKCNGGSDHAIMTAKKWLRDPEYRSTSIADFK